MRSFAEPVWCARLSVFCSALLVALFCSACFIFSPDNVQFPAPVSTTDFVVNVDSDSQADAPDDSDAGDTLGDPVPDERVADADLSETDTVSDATDTETIEADLADGDASDSEVDSADAEVETADAEVETADSDVIEADPASWRVFEPANWENITVGDNMIENPGLENLFDDSSFSHWTEFGDGWVPSEDNPNSGLRAGYVSSDNFEQELGAAQVVEPRQSTPRALWIEASSRSNSAVGDEADHYSLLLVLRGGGETTYHPFPFTPDNHVWESIETLLIPDRPILEVEVHALFKEFSGEAWFDDFALHQVEQSLLTFDEQPVVVLDSDFGDDPALVTLESGDGRLELTLGAAGGWINQLVAGDEGEAVDMTGDSPERSGLFVRDQAAGSDWVHFGGSLEETDDGYHQEGNADDLELTIEAHWISHDRHIEVSGDVRSTAERNRAITLYLALPVRPDDLHRYDRIRVDELIETGETVSHFWEYDAPQPLGATGRYSPNHFGGVGADAGIAVGYPMDHPQFARIFYSEPAQQLVLAVDFGLSTLTDPVLQAGFSFVIYPFETEWGFRAMLQTYTEMFPEFFARGTATEGIWIEDPDIESADNLGNFGIGFRGIDPWSLAPEVVAQNNAHGIVSLRRLFPPSFEDVSIGDIDFENPETVSNRLDSVARTEVRNSLTHDEAGWYRFHTHSGYSGCEPVCAQVVLNANPDVPVTVGSFNWMTSNWGESEQLNYETVSLGGEFLYGLSAYGNRLNYRHDHFSVAELPLLYAQDVWEPAILTLHSTYEGVRFLRNTLPEDVRTDPAEDAILAGQASLHMNAFLAHLFDTLGADVRLVDDGSVEFGWIDGVEGDEYMMAARSAMLTKQFHLALYADDDQFTRDNVSQFMHFCLFYGIFPTFSDNYFESDELRERDQDLFPQIIPISRAISAAGWEPITVARTDNPDVWIERFGAGPTEVYFTLRNTTDSPQTVTVTASLTGLNLAIDNSYDVADLLDGATLTSATAGDSLSFDIQVPAGFTSVVRVADLST